MRLNCIIPLEEKTVFDWENRRWFEARLAASVSREQGEQCDAGMARIYLREKRHSRGNSGGHTHQLRSFRRHRNPAVSVQAYEEVRQRQSTEKSKSRLTIYRNGSTFRLGVELSMNLKNPHFLVISYLVRHFPFNLTHSHSHS